MRSDVPTATFDEAIAGVLEAMASYAVATVPVVTRRKYLEGLVVLDDLARIRGYASAAAKARRRIASRHPGARAPRRG
jgi:CBS domain-containing protein